MWESGTAGGGHATLFISGRAAGPFGVTWMGDVFPACSDGQGIVHGTGLPSTWRAESLPIQARLECVASPVKQEFPMRLTYHPLSETLSVEDASGKTRTWMRPLRRQLAPVRLSLRVNYADNWVEAFYEAGHTIWVTVTESDSVTVKASLEATTQSRDDWHGEPGFSSLDAVWFDPKGNPMEVSPDIGVGDWAFGWVDNGASSSVQIGEIRGVVEPAKDSITGTVRAPWLVGPVGIECLDWRSTPEWLPALYPNKAGGSIRADGVDRYNCSWAGEWDIVESHGIGVAYYDSNDNWVGNAFRTGYYTVFPEQNALEGWEWPDGAVVTATVDGRPSCTGMSTAGYSDQSATSTFVWIDFPRGCDVVIGDRITLSDGTTALTHIVQKLAITGVDVAANTVAGTAEDGATIDAWVHGYYDGSGMQVTANRGQWLADFGSAGLDLTAGMCGRAEIQDIGGNRTAVDWCVPEP